MQRDRAYFRKVRKRTIRKKSALLKRLSSDGLDMYTGWTRGNPGKLAKGKIHCSCWMCRSKSYDGLSHSDLKQEVSATQQFFEVGIHKQPQRKY